MMGSGHFCEFESPLLTKEEALELLEDLESRDIETIQWAYHKEEEIEIGLRVIVRGHECDIRRDSIELDKRM